MNAYRTPVTPDHNPETYGLHDYSKDVERQRRNRPYAIAYFAIKGALLVYLAIEAALGDTWATHHLLILVATALVFAVGVPMMRWWQRRAARTDAFIQNLERNTNEF